jgi:hypothetical protein
MVWRGAVGRFGAPLPVLALQVRPITETTRHTVMAMVLTTIVRRRPSNTGMAMAIGPCGRIPAAIISAESKIAKPGYRASSKRRDGPHCDTTGIMKPR